MQSPPTWTEQTHSGASSSPASTGIGAFDGALGRAWARPILDIELREIEIESRP